MAISEIKNRILGEPLETSKLGEERLPKSLALAVFSSDALSSVAYATEEILLVLFLAGTAALTFSMPITFGIIVLLTILAISYRQVVTAYPSGGGSYIVASENLGQGVGLVAGASLLIDYILTVAVSISAGVAAITSAFPIISAYRVHLAVALVVLVALANLKGVRDSGKLFAVPTYTFIISLLVLIVVGLVRYSMGYSFEAAAAAEQAATLQGITLFLILRAFASGCAALTGVEAISNGVQSFRTPESKNARITLVAMALILGFLFLGITALANVYGLQPSESETILSQLAHGVFGSGASYYIIQAATAMILIVAANTAFADFPRVASVMAHDGFMPKQLKDRGSRLAFSNGIILLAGFAIFLLIFFKGDTHRLIPLYAVGVFTSFTLSQLGMVKRWFKERDKGWRLKAATNGLGALTTFVVLFVITLTKFTHGAWMVVILIPPLILIFRKIKKHYEQVDAEISIEKVLDKDSGTIAVPAAPLISTVVLVGHPFDTVDIEAVVQAKAAANGLIHAVHIDINPQESKELRDEWDKYMKGKALDIPLEIIASPYRSIIGPLTKRIREIEDMRDDDKIIVLIPEIVYRSWWQWFLHHQTATFLRLRLLFWQRVDVWSIPYHMPQKPKK